MTEQLDLEDWLRENPVRHPRQNGKSTLALNFIRLQEELNVANYNTYVEKVKNDLLGKENQQLKELLKECREKLKYCVRETYELQTKIDNAIGEKK